MQSNIWDCPFCKHQANSELMVYCASCGMPRGLETFRQDESQLNSSEQDDKSNFDTERNFPGNSKTMKLDNSPSPSNAEISEKLPSEENSTPVPDSGDAYVQTSPADPAVLPEPVNLSTQDITSTGEDSLTNNPTIDCPGPVTPPHHDLTPSGEDSFNKSLASDVDSGEAVILPEPINPSDSSSKNSFNNNLAKNKESGLTAVLPQTVPSPKILESSGEYTINRDIVSDLVSGSSIDLFQPIIQPLKELSPSLENAPNVMSFFETASDGKAGALDSPSTVNFFAFNEETSSLASEYAANFVSKEHYSKEHYSKVNYYSSTSYSFSPSLNFESKRTPLVSYSRRKRRGYLIYFIIASVAVLGMFVATSDKQRYSELFNNIHSYLKQFQIEGFKHS